MFLILKTQDLTSAVFVCPSSNAQPSALPGVGTNPAGPGSYQCWPDNPLYNVVTYSIESPFPSSTALSGGWKWNAAIAPDYAIAADINPGGSATLQPGQAQVQAITPGSSRIAMMGGNSPNHLQEGQNVMFGDFHVEWFPSCFAGSTQGTGTNTWQDNIYTANSSSGSANYVGTNSPNNDKSPVDRFDTILLPTYTPN
jgi:hypothetical protein